MWRSSFSTFPPIASTVQKLVSSLGGRKGNGRARRQPRASANHAGRSSQLRRKRYYDRCSDAYTAFVAAVAASAFAQFVAEFEPLAKLYADYKRQAALLDFDDLLYHARDLLAGNEHVRQALAQRYPRILVDEFQDTDPLQAEILWHLCGEGDQGAPWTERKLRAGSLFVVGDPKQAIYRFRGADVDTYLEAKRAILAQDPDAVLEIVANFRSLKQIIDFANDQFRGLLSPENGQPGFTALQPTRLPRDERPAVACFDVTIGDDHKTDKGKIVVDRVRREEEGANTLELRARNLLSELGVPEAGRAEDGPHAPELAASVRRALGIPEVAALRHRLLPEMTVFSAEPAGQGTIYVGGVADAVAFDGGNNVDVVVDWKSDVEPATAVVDLYREQVRDYLAATGGKEGLSRGRPAKDDDADGR